MPSTTPDTKHAKILDTRVVSGIANMFAGDPRIEDLVESHEQLRVDVEVQRARAKMWMSRAAKSGAASLAARGES